MEHGLPYEASQLLARVLVIMLLSIVSESIQVLACQDNGLRISEH